MFSSAEQTLKSSLKALGKDFYLNYLRHALFFNWRSLVGDTVADHVRPAKLEYKTLFVAIDSAPWKMEFQFKKSAVIKAINDDAECKLIDEILIGRAFKALTPPSHDPDPLTPDEIIARDLPNVSLTDEELDEILSNSPAIENERLRTIMLDTSKARARLRKCRLKHGWKRCATCERLVPPGEVFCDDCLLKELERFRQTVAEVIREVPWLTYAQLHREMENRMPHMIKQLYPETVSSIRATAVQQLARSIDLRDKRQLKRLVMIYRQLPPDALNDDVIKRTMRQLRFDLPLTVDDF